ncbi:MarR family winged helix-turn-helix transcriptional regulator [Microbacterium sp. No. 7]|uniref:MarR family winged helix-turn-helix transcriptional regulator n=1 Tax=Microbacterium sp. No. 7 TaxID=1714373 RepID=UPI0006CF5224|nr:MarR family transcriptional regulator [Microbacterium sp. No. 7]
MLPEVEAVLDPEAEGVEVLADLVLNVGRKIQARTVAEVGPAVLTHLEVLVLRHVARQPGVTPTALARQLSLKSSNTSAVLRSLEHHGLVARTTDSSDRRIVRVIPTEATGRMVGDVSRYWEGLLGSLIPETHLHAALIALRALDAALED